MSSGIEPLEARIAPAATALAITRALDLADGTSISISGNPASIATMKLASTGQLFGFPSGSDGDFLVLSTGVASHLTSWANTGDGQGTDLGAIGADGDTVSISFSLDVPQVSAGLQRFKLDFSFLTDEYPEFLGASDTDTFTVTINGVNYAVDSHGNAMGVNNDYFHGAPAPGTYFDGRTDKLTLTYAVPAGITKLDVELKLSDVGDGQVDSAVLVDNVRFETAEKIFLNFQGGQSDTNFGPGIAATLPAFKPEDLGSDADVQELIGQIVAKLQEKFAGYDITFVTTQPSYGNYSTVIIGGDNSMQLDLSQANPLVKAHFPNGTGSVSDVLGLGDDALLGISNAPDVGNLNHNDKAVIFSGEFAGFYPNLTPDQRVEQLAGTIAHEIGHNLGLRHVTSSNSGDLMSDSPNRDSTATFGDSLVALTEQWSDGVTEQNDNAYLLAVLGGSGAGATGLHAAAVAATTTTMNVLPKLSQTLYNATIHITTGDADGGGFTLHFNKLDGHQPISLPALLPVDAKISITGASVLNGPIDTFTGTPHGALLTDQDLLVPLFDAGGHLATLTLAKQESSGIFTNGGTVPLTPGTLGNVILLPGKTATFTDSDGDLYTIKLTGPGNMGYLLDDPDLNGQGGLAQLVLDGTTFDQSTLTITVLKRGPNGDGRVLAGEITGTAGAGLKSLSAPGLDFIGNGIMFSGALGAVTIGDLADDGNILGGPAVGSTVKSSIRAHAIGDGVQIALGTDVSLLQASRLGDASISLPSLAKLVVTGNKLAGLTPDFDAQLNVTGLLGSVSAGDFHSSASITAGGSPLDRTVLAMRSVADGVSVAVASTVTSLRATAVGDASFSAQQFGTVTLTGTLAGDFTAIGKIGHLTARDLLGTGSITAGGLATDKTTLSFATIHDGASIAVDSTITLLHAVKVDHATISAAAIGTLSVTGNVSAGLAGNFAGTLTLEGGDNVFKNGLTKANIAGAVTGASITTECIGTFSAGSVVDSSIFAGYSPADPQHAMDGGVFFEGGTIKSFVVRGAHPGLENSVIAAMSISSIRVLGLDIDNGGTAFGFITDVAPTKVTVKGYSYDKSGVADQGMGDFHLRLV